MSAGRQRLQQVFARLDRDRQHQLLEFAEFLATRQVEPAPEEAAARCDIPRPADESVVAALKRLRATYPMLDSAPLLDAAATLVSAHVLQGRGAGEVIDELETLFASAYAEHSATGEGLR